MPIIPTYEANRSEYPENPPEADVNPARFGRDAAALAGLGGEIGDFGSRLMQARKQAEENDAIANESSEYRRWFANRSLEMARENPQGYAEQLRSEMEEKHKEIVERLPTGDAQRTYNARLSGFNSEAYAQALAHQAANKIESYKTNFSKRINISATDIAQEPIPESMLGKMHGSLRSHLQDLELASSGDGAIFSKDQAKEIGIEAGSKMATGLMVAYSESERGAKAGLDALDRADENGLNEMMTPEQMRMWRERFESAVKNRSRESSSGWSTTGNNIVSNLLSGDPSKTAIGLSEMDAHTKHGELLERDGVITPQQRNESEITIAMAAANGLVLNELAKMPDNDFEKANSLVRAKYHDELSKRGISPNTAAAHNNRFEEAVAGTWAKIMHDREKDRNGYIERTWAGDLPPDDGSGVPTDDRIAKMQGLANVLNASVATNGVLSEPRREGLRLRLKALAESDPDKAVDLLERIKSSKHSRQIIDDLRDGDKLPNFLYAASFMPSRDGMRSVVTNFQSKNSAALREQYQRLTPVNKDMFDKKLDESMRSFSSSIAAMGPDNARITEAFREAVSAEAMNMNREGRIGYLDRDSAIDAAYQKIIGNNFVFSGPNGRSVIIPRTIGKVVVSPVAVEAKMQEIYNPKTWASWDIRPPGGNPNKIDDALRRGQWVTNRAMTGMEFWYSDDAGVHKITNGQGTPITVGFAETTLKYNRPKSFTEKIVDSLGEDKFTKKKLGLEGPQKAPWESLTEPEGGARVEPLSFSWLFGWGKSGGDGKKTVTHDAVRTDTYAVPNPAQYFNKPKTEEEINKLPAAPMYQDAPFNPEDAVKYRSPITGQQSGSKIGVVTSYRVGQKERVMVGGKMVDAQTITETRRVGDPLKIYGGFITKAETGEGIPPGLLTNLLVHESAGMFDSAVKSNTGATGLGQFTSAAAKDRGMSDIDRLDPWKSITAAAKHFKLGRDKLGSWEAAIPAYNYGISGFGKLLKKAGGDVEKAIELIPNEKKRKETREHYKLVMSGVSGSLPQETKGAK